MRRNLRFRRGELDLVAVDRAGALVVLEVRGGRSPGWFPSLMLSPAKRGRLERLALQMGAATQKPVRLELIEVTGRGPRRPCLLWLWLAAFRPEWLGLKISAFAIR